LLSLEGHGFLISIDQARALIFEHATLGRTHEIPVSSGRAEVIQGSLKADRPFPPFDRVAMDGIAVCHKDIQAGIKNFVIRAMQRAGETQVTPEQWTSKTVGSLEYDGQQFANCIEVMTGAMLPQGFDTVIRYEDLEIDRGVANLSKDLNMAYGANVHDKGSDYAEGTELISDGQHLLPAHWAVVATVGAERVKTLAMPRIAVVSTGDELVDVGQVPEAHQIRKSNTYAINAALCLHHFENINCFHINDDPEEITATMTKVLDEHDVVLTMGGVSMGKFDFLPTVLVDLGVQKIFHKVSQRPGKPLWFGRKKNGPLVFGLPGNPVSVLVNLYAHVLPALFAMTGRAERRFHGFARLSEDFEFDKAMTFFLPVKIETKSDAVTYATPVPTNGSGDFGRLLQSDGFVELAADCKSFAKGTVLPLFTWTGG
jgi:molybdopterin molybdotransferase